jgi:hypothetical protein
MTYLQRSLSSSARKLLRSIPPFSTFHSSLLQNSTDQHSSSPLYPLTSPSLTTPIHKRRSQLQNFAATQLHLAAQQTVLAAFSSLAVGTGIGWSGWYGLLGYSVNTSTAIGLGALCGLLGVRWAVGRWERAKRKWWLNWTRVGDGLGRDLEASHSEGGPACSAIETILLGYLRSDYSRPGRTGSQRYCKRDARIGKEKATGCRPHPRRFGGS